MDLITVGGIAPIVVRRSAGAVKQQQDMVVRETPITVYVNGWETATLISSPDGIRELTVGFLFGEGILTQIDDLESLVIETETGSVHVEIKGYSLQSSPGFVKRYTGSCYGRSLTSFYYLSDARLCRENTNEVQISSNTVFQLMDSLEARAHIFRRTGGVHCAALADENGLIAYYEDIGRHNTLDKLLGYKLLGNVETEDKIIVFSGRVSSEIVLKVSKLHCPILIARSAPTELALTLADDLGVTVVGFARDERFNLYTHPGRVYITPPLNDRVSSERSGMPG